MTHLQKQKRGTALWNVPPRILTTGSYKTRAALFSSERAPRIKRAAHFFTDLPPFNRRIRTPRPRISSPAAKENRAPSHSPIVGVCVRKPFPHKPLRGGGECPLTQREPGNENKINNDSPFVYSPEEFAENTSKVRPNPRLFHGPPQSSPSP